MLELTTTLVEAADLTETNEAVGALDGRVDKLEAAPTSPAVVTGMPAVVIAKLDDASIQAGMKEWLATRNSAGYPTKRLVFSSAGTYDVRTPLMPVDNKLLIQSPRIEGLARRATTLRYTPADVAVPMWSQIGGLKDFSFSELGFASGKDGAKGFYLFSDNTGANQNGEWAVCEFKGGWDYGVAFDGDADANLNSEISFLDFNATGDTWFNTALVVCGLTGDDPQEDQFLNYHFADTKFEASHGTYLLYRKGGFVIFDGYNSWMHTGQAAADKVARGVMVSMPPSTHFDAVQHFLAQGVRAEMRSDQSKLIDCAWSAGGRVIWEGLDTSSWSYKVGAYESETYRGGALAWYQGCTHGAYVGVRDKGARVALDFPDCKAKMTPDAQATGVVRNINAPAASFKTAFRNL